MKFGTEYKGCRYWGFEPASREFIHTPMDRAAKKEIEDRVKSDAATIKAAGFKVQVYGIGSKYEAAGRAEEVEKATGVEMRVFNHDYI